MMEVSPSLWIRNEIDPMHLFIDNSIAELQYHTDRLASGEAVNFTAFENIGGSNVHDAIKIHGASSLVFYIINLVI